MKITIDRKPRNESEDVSLTVYANSEKEVNRHHQFKIDVWSIKNSGLSYLRNNSACATCARTCARLNSAYAR